MTSGFIAAFLSAPSADRQTDETTDKIISTVHPSGQTPGWIVSQKICYIAAFGWVVRRSFTTMAGGSGRTLVKECAQALLCLVVCVCVCVCVDSFFFDSSQH